MNILSYYVKDLKDSLKNKDYKQVNNKYKIAIYYKSILLYFYNKQLNTIYIYNDTYTKQFPKYFHKKYIELILPNKIYKFNHVKLVMKNLINSWIEYKWYKSKFYLIKTYFCYEQAFRWYNYEIKYINNKIYKRYKELYNKYRKRVIFIENKYELEYYSKVLFALF
jgi:hypothetical protein